MSELQEYYNEHAAQARQHENDRERMTSIILSVAGVLVGLITFAKLSVGALPAALAIVALGIFGFLFAGKHYERFRFHTSIMAEIRDEIDRLRLAPNEAPRPLAELRDAGDARHYRTFTWPRFS